MLREYRKILSRKEFNISFMLLFFSVIGEFIYGCKMFRNVSLSGVISAYDGTILSNNFNSPFGICYGVLLPVIVSLMGSTSAYEEKKQNILSSIYTRTNRTKYIWEQGGAVFLASFLGVLFCLGISFLLASIMLPIQGHNTMFMTDYAKLVSADSEYMLDELYRLHPYLNLCVFIFMRAMFAGAFAFMAYGISFFGRWVNKIIIVLSPILWLICYQMAFAILKRIFEGKNLHLWFSSDILSMNHYGKFQVLIVLWLILVLIGILGMVKEMRRGDVL